MVFVKDNEFYLCVVLWWCLLRMLFWMFFWDVVINVEKNRIYCCYCYKWNKIKIEKILLVVVLIE